MKYIILISFLLTLNFLSGEIICEIDDIEGDDYGNGSIVYPEHLMFIEGVFDLLQFKLELEEDEYIFSFTMKGKLFDVEHHEFEYNYSLPENFILPLIHVYIDQDHINDSGFTETVAGTNVTINPENAWERVVILSSIPDRYKGSLKSKQEEISKRTLVPDKIFRSRNKKTISVKVPVKLLGKVTTDWGFTVLIMGHEFSQTIKKNIYVREVKQTSNQYNFGGAEGGFFKQYDPNVIDLLSEYPGKQEHLLKGFSKKDKTYACVTAVYPFKTELKHNLSTGLVKQISKEKVVINIGSLNNIKIGDELLVNNQISVVARDVFPELTIAEFSNEKDWLKIEVGMKVTKINRVDSTDSEEE